MSNDNDNLSRRTLLGGVAASAVTLAGCSTLGQISDSTPTNSSTATQTGTPSETTDQQTDQPQQAASQPGTNEPMNAKAASFEDLGYWSAHAGVKLSADTDTVYSGSQAARVENRSGTIERSFPVPVNLEKKDLSLVMNVGSPTNTIVSVYLQDTGGKTTKLVQPIYQTMHPDEWVRINPSVDETNADMTSISRMLVTIDGPGKGKKYWVDSIRFHDKTFDKPQVMFTFDYITRPIYEVAFPIMKKRGLKGCVAVPVDHVGNADRLTRDELTELQKAGWEIASMSNSFGSMHGQSKDIQRRRLERAIRLLKEWGLGKPKTLMYPKGACDTTTVKLADELHDVAFTKFNNSQAGHTQSWVANPSFVNRGRPNSPHALENQLPALTGYNSVYPIWHNELGPDAQNSKSEFRQLCDIVATQRDKGKLGVSLPGDLVTNR